MNIRYVSRFRFRHFRLVYKVHPLVWLLEVVAAGLAFHALRERRLWLAALGFLTQMLIAAFEYLRIVDAERR